MRPANHQRSGNQGRVRKYPRPQWFPACDDPSRGWARRGGSDSRRRLAQDARRPRRLARSDHLPPRSSNHSNFWTQRAKIAVWAGISLFPALPCSTPECGDGSTIRSSGSSQLTPSSTPECDDGSTGDNRSSSPLELMLREASELGVACAPHFMGAPGSCRPFVVSIWK